MLNTAGRSAVVSYARQLILLFSVLFHLVTAGRKSDFKVVKDLTNGVKGDGCSVITTTTITYCN